MSTLTTLQDIMINDYRLTRAQLAPEAELSSLGIDSLDMLELFFKIEERLGIKIWNEVPGSLRTVHDVVAYVDDLRARQATVRDAPVPDHRVTPP